MREGALIQGDVDMGFIDGNGRGDISVLEVVAGGGIEPPTQGFSVLCSTN
jgi:hypothetical protein